MKKDLKPLKETNQELNIYQKLQAVQHHISQLQKDQLNKFQNYKYVAEYDILRTLKPLLNQQHLTLTFDDTEEPIKAEEQATQKGGKEWLVQYRKRAILTNSEQPTEQLTYYFWAMGQNTDIAKAKGSAETYAIKYFLQKFFLIPTSEVLDPDERDDGSEMKEENEITKTAKKPKKEFQPEITTTLLNIKEKFDKNKDKYLLLETTDLDNNIFVFSYRVEEERWGELKVGLTYQFSLEESNKGLCLLVDFALT